jgi:hypothetical protein
VQLDGGVEERLPIPGRAPMTPRANIKVTARPRVDPDHERGEQVHDAVFQQRPRRRPRLGHRPIADPQDESAGAGVVVSFGPHTAPSGRHEAEAPRTFGPSTRSTATPALQSEGVLMRGRCFRCLEVLARGIHTEEVTGSNPVSPTSVSPSRMHISDLTSNWRAA